MHFEADATTEHITGKIMWGLGLETHRTKFTLSSKKQALSPLSGINQRVGRKQTAGTVILARKVR